MNRMWILAVVVVTALGCGGGAQQPAEDAEETPTGEITSMDFEGGEGGGVGDATTMDFEDGAAPADEGDGEAGDAPTGAGG